MKTTLLFSLLVVCFSALAVELRTVGTNTLTFYNFSSGDYDLGGHHITVGETHYMVDELTVQKTLIVPAGQSVTLGTLTIPTTPSSITLWYPGTFPTSIVDFMQYGAASQPYETEAVSAVRWVAGEFVAGTPPFERTSLVFTDIGAGYWEETAATNVQGVLPEVTLRVTPNPFINEIVVETDIISGKGYDLVLFDAKGMEVIKMQGIREKEVKIESAHLLPGSYYMKLESEMGVEVVPVFKH